LRKESGLKKINKIHIDWLDVMVDITHNSQELSNGVKLYLNKDLDFSKAQKSCLPINIMSVHNHKLKVKSVNGKLRISGNFYKWLHGENINGCDSILNLVVDVLLKFEEMGLVQPTIREYQIIRNGQFRIYQVHIKQDMIFNNNNLALSYLEGIKKGGYYPYRKKAIYQNGVYFGLRSKRWVLGFYHKGKEIDQAKKNRCVVTQVQKALADMMIRSEIKIYPPQLNDWDLRFGWQWFDIDNLNNIFKRRLDELKLPDFSKVIELDEINNSADKKFYYCLKNGGVETLYSRGTIDRMRKKFMKEYNVDIDSVYNNQLGSNVCKY